MGKLNFEFIRKINHVLIFLGACAGIVFICVLVGCAIFDAISSSSSRDESAVFVKTDAADVASPSDVEAENNAENEGGVKEEEEKEYIEFNRMLKDVYVFDVLDSSLCVKKDVTRSRYSRSTEARNKSVHANFLFVNSNKEEHKLFPTNSQYIIKHSFRDSCAIYVVIKHDTNGDKVLDFSDDASLYVSDYDGKNLMEMSSSVFDSKPIGKGLILITEFHDDELKFYVLDCVKREKNLIKSVKQKASKSICLVF